MKACCVFDYRCSYAHLDDKRFWPNHWNCHASTRVGERKSVFPTASYSTNFSYCTCTFSQQLSEKLHQSLDWQYGIQFPCVKDPWGRISCFLNPHCRAICRLPSIKTCFYGCFWMYFQCRAICDQLWQNPTLVGTSHCAAEAKEGNMTQRAIFRFFCRIEFGEVFTNTAVKLLTSNYWINTVKFYFKVILHSCHLQTVFKTRWKRQFSTTPASSDFHKNGIK